jgi:hypothetical protein
MILAGFNPRDRRFRGSINDFIVVVVAVAVAVAVAVVLVDCRTFL